MGQRARRGEVDSLSHVIDVRHNMLFVGSAGASSSWRVVRDSR
jgi:hypothetical protein